MDEEPIHCCRNDVCWCRTRPAWHRKYTWSEGRDRYRRHEKMDMAFEVAVGVSDAAVAFLASCKTVPMVAVENYLCHNGNNGGSHDEPNQEA